MKVKCPQCLKVIVVLRKDDDDWTEEELQQGFVVNDEPCRRCAP